MDHPNLTGLGSGDLYKSRAAFLGKTPRVQASRTTTTLEPKNKF